MIYFDKKHNAYGDKLSIEGKEIVYTCENVIWEKAQEGMYIWEGDELVLNPNYDNELLQQAKENKIAENDELRDTALSGGVIYKDVLFDSDTDQKINLLSTVETLSDEDTIVWYGMNNEPLLCNKEDLYNIGYLIKELTTYCWTHNSEIKQEIYNASTIEELDNIVIDYDRKEE